MIKQLEDQIDKLKSELNIPNLLNNLLKYDFEPHVIDFVQKYKPFPASKYSIDEYVAKHKIKIKKKRKFGVVSIGAYLRGGDEARDKWLNFNSTIHNTIWLSNGYNDKSQEQQNVLMAHEINHHILSKFFGQIKYDALYLTQSFRLMIELAAYKTNYIHAGDKDLYAHNLASKLAKDYELKFTEKQILNIIQKSYI